MHKYIIKLTRYTEAGAPTSDISYVTADTPQGLADKVNQYRKMHYTNEDGSNGFAMYKVEPMQGEYQAIADFDGFCDINAVLR